MSYILPIFRKDDPSKVHIDGKCFPLEWHLPHQSPSDHSGHRCIGLKWEHNPILDQPWTWIEQKPGDRIPMKAGDRRSGLNNETLSDEGHEPFLFS